jgi:hypothetical protein
MQQQELVAGDSLNFLTAGGAYPASSGWMLKYRLVPRTVGNGVQELTATAEGNDHRIAVAASSTTGWAADNYTWTSWVEKSGEVYTLEQGQLTVKQNPRTAGAGYDGRSQARKALDDARAAFAAWSPVKRRYKIGEREMEFNSTAEIIKLITWWEQQVMAEDLQAGRAEKIGRRIFSRI